MDKKEQIRDRIIEKAKEKFGRLGYSNVKTEMLASELGISKRTLYNLFPSKHSILKIVIEKTLIAIENNFHCFIDDITKNDKIDFLSGLIETWKKNVQITSAFSSDFYHDLEKNVPESFEKILNFRSRNLQEHFWSLYDIGVNKGFLKPSINKNVFFMMHYFSLQHIMIPENISKLSLSPQEIIDAIYEIFFTGTLTEMGLENYKSVRCCKDNNMI